MLRQEAEAFFGAVRFFTRLPVPAWVGHSQEALDRAATIFRNAIDAHGPTTFGLFSCSKATNELNFMTQKFARVVVGSNNIDSCNRT